MKLIIVLSLLITFTLSQRPPPTSPPPRQSQCDCGRYQTDENARIYFGNSVAQIGRYPWQILLEIVTHENQFPIQVNSVNSYGGGLISKRHIARAAHCMTLMTNQRYVMILHIER